MSEIEEIKRSLECTSGEIYTISKQQKIKADMMSEIKELNKQNEERETRISRLESRVVGLEQSSRMTDIIISRLGIKLWCTTGICVRSKMIHNVHS